MSKSAADGDRVKDSDLVSRHFIFVSEPGAPFTVAASDPKMGLSANAITTGLASALTMLLRLALPITGLALVTAARAECAGSIQSAVTATGLAY